MTLDGYCDHTAMNADDELLQHYADLLHSTGAVLYGRVTYHLMEYWLDILKNPTGNGAMDEFARAIDVVPKIVFSKTLKNTEWASAKLATGSLEEESVKLKQKPGKDVLVGSPGLIAALTNLDLIDEYQLCIHPVIAGNGLPLFKNISHAIKLSFIKTKIFHCGAVVVYYKRIKLEKR